MREKKTQTQTNKQQKQESIFKRIKIEFNVSIWIGGRPIVCVCERVDGVASTTLEDMTHKSNHSITAIDASAAADTESY